MRFLNFYMKQVTSLKWDHVRFQEYFHPVFLTVAMPQLYHPAVPSHWSSCLLTSITLVTHLHTPSPLCLLYHLHYLLLSHLPLSSHLLWLTLLIPFSHMICSTSLSLSPLVLSTSCFLSFSPLVSSCRYRLPVSSYLPSLSPLISFSSDLPLSNQSHSSLLHLFMYLFPLVSSSCLISSAHLSLFVSYLIWVLCIPYLILFPEPLFPMSHLFSYPPHMVIYPLSCALPILIA